MNKIVEGGVWINLHKPNTKFEGYIVEIRESSGYGIRWTLEGEFRGLVEP